MRLRCRLAYKLCKIFLKAVQNKVKLDAETGGKAARAQSWLAMCMFHFHVEEAMAFALHNTEVFMCGQVIKRRKTSKELPERQGRVRQATQLKMRNLHRVDWPRGCCCEHQGRLACGEAQ